MVDRGAYGIYPQWVGTRPDTEDQAQIETVLAKSRDLYQLIGDCGDEYRR